MQEQALAALIRNTEPVHTRNLLINSYPAPDHRIVVEGWLKDERHVDTYRYGEPEPRKAGVVHWFCARLLVGEWPMTILDAEAEIRQVPAGECVEVFGTVKQVVGMQISPGYSEQVRHAIGGPNGCAHLTHLLIVMGPAALHGFFTMVSKRPRPLPETMEEMEDGLKYLVNTCALWKPDGLHMQKLREAMARRGGGGDA